MPTALSVLNSLGFRQLRPGENDQGFGFSGPGVVVIACEDTSAPASEIRFRLITAADADTDALAIAKSLLNQSWSCSGYVFALLAPVANSSARKEAVATLEKMCSAGV